MRRLLTTTTALSMVLAPLQPLPGVAQVPVNVNDGVVMCLPDASVACPEGASCVVMPEAPCTPEAVAAAQAALQAAADKAAADAAGAEQAAAEKAAADAAAAEQAAAEKAAADAAAAEQAAADTAAADAAAAEQAAADTAAADAAAAAQAAADTAAAAAAAADQAAADKAAADQAAADKAAADAAETAAAADQAAADQAAADKAATEAAAAAADAAVAAKAAEDAAAAAGTAAVVAPAAEADAAISSLTDILSGTTATEPAPAAAAETAAPVQPDATVIEVTPADSRTSAQDFVAAPAAEPTVAGAPAKRKGMTNLEKFGLAVVGALVVGAVLKNGDKVVSNTGDRVVMQRDDGSYVVLKDDDTLLRQPGATVRTENFADGSTRATVTRGDGSRIVTIRDAAGRVLQRTRIDADGREVYLIDDLTPVETVDVTTLPLPQPNRTVISGQDDAAALRAALLARETTDLGRSFSLRQVREYREVRALAPTIDVESITFPTASAAIKATEAAKLARLGKLVSSLIAANPSEMFLIEGHTDAVGSAASNLALSDRRAESLALALTEYYGVPPENLVVQGYGETELRIDTQSGEAANRRAAVRLISPLLQQLATR